MLCRSSEMGFHRSLLLHFKYLLRWRWMTMDFQAVLDTEKWRSNSGKLCCQSWSCIFYRKVRIFLTQRSKEATKSSIHWSTKLTFCASYLGASSVAIIPDGLARIMRLQSRLQLQRRFPSTTHGRRYRPIVRNNVNNACCIRRDRTRQLTAQTVDGPSKRPSWRPTELRFVFNFDYWDYFKSRFQQKNVKSVWHRRTLYHRNCQS